jgi:hypothetical protein
MAQEMWKVIGYDSFSELPGIHLGTCWTVRSAMLMNKVLSKRGEKNSVEYSSAQARSSRWQDTTQR